MHSVSLSQKIWALSIAVVALASAGGDARAEDSAIVRAIVEQGAADATMDINSDGGIDSADVVREGLPTPTATETPTPTPTPGPQAIIRPTLLSGDPCVPDSDFTVRIEVASNPAATLPLAANLRVYYPTDQVEFVTAADGALGTVYFGPETATTTSGLPSAHRNLVTVGNFGNEDDTPVVYDLLFRTRPGFQPGPYSIVVADDDRSSSNLLDRQLGNIPHGFDNSVLNPLCSSPTATPTPSQTAPGGS